MDKPMVLRQRSHLQHEKDGDNDYCVPEGRQNHQTPKYILLWLDSKQEEVF